MTTIQDRIIQSFIDRGFVKEGDWLNNPKAKQVVSCYAKPVIEFLVESIKEVQEETRKEVVEECKQKMAQSNEWWNKKLLSITNKEKQK